MRKICEFRVLLSLAVILTVSIHILAPSVVSQEPVQSGQLEKVKLIISVGIDNFVRDLNENGRLGYRLENSLNYGGNAEPESLNEFKRLVDEGYKVKDLFYASGLNVIFEK